MDLSYYPCIQPSPQAHPSLSTCMLHEIGEPWDDVYTCIVCWSRHSYCINLALDYVPLEEQHDQFINPGQIFKYIGEEKVIQGHQNSSYLDSTVFGLFAVSDVFDNMFLQRQHDDPDGDAVKYLLWKGIVNPLRKYACWIYNIIHVCIGCSVAETALIAEWAKNLMLNLHIACTASKHVVRVEKGQ